MAGPSRSPSRESGAFSPPAGLRRLGAYRLESSLGRGGMGEVYLAWDERLHRRVAIKQLRGDLPLEDRHRQRFRQEARAVARLSHPAIVQIYDILESDPGQEEAGDALVMEHVEGSTLAEALARREIDLESALRLAWEVADGLAEAHGRGLVHRDLKPENVLVTRSGHAKIVDFGLARVLWGEPSEKDEDPPSALTQAGALVGTVHAMSPEQASGRAVDHRADLFALGGLLYEMLAGRAPFRGENLLDTLRRITSERPEPLAEVQPDLPPGLAELVESLLAKNPEERPQNARVVADALERLRSGAAEGAHPATPATLPTPWPPTPPPTPAPDSDPDPDQPTGEWPEPGAVSDTPAPSAALRVLVRTDLVRSTGLTESLGDARAAELLTRHDRLARDLLAHHGGLEIDKSDGFLLLFERPADAVAFALGYHQGLERLAQQEGVELEARAGIHLGEVYLRRNPDSDVARGAKPLEVEGLAKPLAARVMGLAEGRQTLLTRGAFDLARRAAAEGDLADPGLRWLAHGDYAVAGVEDAVEVFEVGLRGFAPLKEPKDTNKVRRAVAPSEELTLGWRPASGQPIPRRPNWTLLERLGEGGFGEVWLAEHKSGDRRVFKFCFEAARLKALKREVTLFRLMKEALGHRDDIARILDWHFDDAPYFLEAEYTEGGSLPAWAVEQGGLAEVPLPTRLELAAEVAEALAAAHSVGILHKDVKPENVLVTTDREGRPRARLTDFGVGLLTERERLADPGFTALGFTETMASTGSSAAGTLGYLAPELIEGKAPSVQADLYSLGVLLYQLVVADFSRTLAPGWERDVGDEILAEDIALFVDGQPEQRPASAREVAERLRTLEARRTARAEEEARRLAFERSQRRRRLATVVAAVAVVVLAVVAFMAVRESRARREAEAAEERATLRQQQAEGLIGFMLGDLRTKLDGVGRLDVLDDVGAQAMEYFAAVPVGELSDEEILRRAQALYQIGDVQVRRGRFPEAERAFEESLALSRALVHRNPSDSESLLSLSNSYFYVGAGYWEQGALELALAYLEKSRDAVAELVRAEPLRTDLRLELASGEGNVGRLLEALHKPEEALEHYSRNLGIIIALAEEKPSDLELQSELGFSHLTFGSALEALGELAGALDHYSQGLEVHRILALREPQNMKHQEALHTSLSYVGSAYEWLGQLDQALPYYREALETSEHLASLDQNNVEWQRGLATALRRWGRLAAYRGDRATALEALQESLLILGNLSAKDRSRPRWRLQTAEVRLDLAITWVMSGRIAKAFEQVDLVRKALSEASDGDSIELQALEIAAWAELLRGKLEALSGHHRVSGEAWRSALHQIRPLAEGSRNPRFLAPLAVALTLVEDPAADAFRSRLEAQGFARPIYGFMLEEDPLARNPIKGEDYGT